MRRVLLAVGVVLLSSASAATAVADPLPPLPATAPATAPAPAPTPATATATAPAPAPTPAPTPTTATAPNGLAVVAMAGATDAAWPLAREVYAAPSLRPYGVDEARARVLAGEPPAANASPEIRDLAETVAGIHGEDAPSRSILGDVAHRLNVRALVVVHMGADAPEARVFFADGAAFDAATYYPDGAGAVTWAAATRSLERAFGTAQGPAGPGMAAPALATHEEPTFENEPPKPKAFYESGWFWGALGAAAFAGGAVFFATRDNTPSTIHLQMNVPH